MENLMELRKRKGMSREVLAKRINVSARAVAAYETGERRPLPETAEKIANIFGLTIPQIWEMFYMAGKSDDVVAFENHEAEDNP